ncbi:hypothetical protein EMCRGX_G031666 [Ephydatia muelleri]
MDAQSDISAWISRIPKVTRWWFFSSFFLPLTTKLGILSPVYLVLLPEAISSFQIWRFVTCLLWFPVNFRWLMMLYFLYSYSSMLETGIFSGTPADYIFMLLFNSFSIVVIGFIVQLPILGSALIFSVLYLWCQVNRETIVTFWFGIQVKAMYFPWVLFFFFFILGDDWVTMLLGIVVGHLYYFITDTWPQYYGGRQFISTPQFLHNWFPSNRRIAGFGVPPASRRPVGGEGEQRRGGHTWGQGQRLGD